MWGPIALEPTVPAAAPRPPVAARGEVRLLRPMPQLADRFELRERRGELGFRDRDLFLCRLVLHRLFGGALRFQRGLFVQVLRANGRVGEYRHDIGLHFEKAALDEYELFGRAVRRLDPHGARLDLREQRRVARIDAELTHHARENDELRLARVDLLFGAHDVDVDRIGHYCSVFAFSNASSIVPTM